VTVEHGVGNEVPARVIMPQGQGRNYCRQGVVLVVFQGSCYSPLTVQALGRTALLVIQNRRQRLGV